MNATKTQTPVQLLSDRVAVITGGSIGIGLSTAVTLAAQGAAVVLVGRDKGRLDRAWQQIERRTGSRKGLGLELDVTQAADMERMAGLTLDRLGRIDILVTAAGILRAKGGRLATLQRMTEAEWDEVIDTNLKGVFRSNRAVIPAMIRQRSGDIINLSSTSGRKGLAFDTAYCASKFGVIGLTEALAEELRPHGIRVQVVLPGAIDTGMWDQNGPLFAPKDILTPDRVADFIGHLLTASGDVVMGSPVVAPLKRHAAIERPGGSTR